MLGKRLKRVAVLAVAGGVIAGIGLGLNQLRKSSLFVVRQIDVEGLDRASIPGGILKSPYSEEMIRSLTGIREGESRLFDLPLKGIREDIETLPWIRSVSIRKRLPGTVIVNVEFRQPVALVQTGDGHLQYLAQDRSRFGPVDFKIMSNLPVISMNNSEVELDQIFSILAFAKSHLEPALVQISAIQLGAQIRLQLSMPLAAGPRIRPVVTLMPSRPGSQDFDMNQSFSRLASVSRYLRSHSIPARAIRLGDSKKIVVKTSRGS